MEKLSREEAYKEFLERFDECEKAYEKYRETDRQYFSIGPFIPAQPIAFNKVMDDTAHKEIDQVSRELDQAKQKLDEARRQYIKAGTGI